MNPPVNTTIPKHTHSASVEATGDEARSELAQELVRPKWEERGNALLCRREPGKLTQEFLKLA
jgi:hypothetical protein